MSNHFSELDKDLQQLALVDWQTFVQLIGEDAIVSAKVCILKSRSKSLQQIGSRLNITKNQVRNRCKQCDSANPTMLQRYSNE